MKRSFRLLIGAEEMEVTVEREGDDLVVERSGESFRVTLLPEGGPTERPFASVDPPAVDSPVTASPAANLNPRQDSPTDAPRPAPTTGEAASGSAAPGSVPAPITGTVKEVLVEAGERVTQGERILMMEAMKMDIEIVAPTAGRLAALFVRPGESVKEHQALFRIE